MTFEQLAFDYLYSSGMFEHQAREVIEMAKSHELFTELKNRWHDDTEGYPVELKSVIIVSLKSVAVEWIDENMPRAWFRAVFAN